MTSTPTVSHGIAVIGAASVFVVAATGAACDRRVESAGPSSAPGARDHLAMSAEQIRLGGIRWALVRETTMTDAIEVPAKLAPNEDRTARLGAPARARVVTVHVRIGDRVSRGAPLVTLQSEQASAARADYAKAAAEVTAHDTAARYARTALDRAERLLTLKAVSRQEAERTRVENEEAESARVQAHADLERARLTLDQLGVDAETGAMIVRAPLAGIVLSRDAVSGSVIDAGAPLIAVTDPATLWLDIAATERIAPQLRRGTHVHFTVAELLPTTFEAAIQNVGAALDPSTRTLPVYGLVSNPAGTLRPAMFATVRLTVGQARTGVSVPESALQLLERRPVVFIAMPDGSGGARFDRREVDLGARTGGDVQIIRGLNAGEVVVSEGAFAVKSEFARSKVPME